MNRIIKQFSLLAAPLALIGCGAGEKAPQEQTQSISAPKVLNAYKACGQDDMNITKAYLQAIIKS